MEKEWFYKEGYEKLRRLKALQEKELLLSILWVYKMNGLLKNISHLA